MVDIRSYSRNSGSTSQDSDTATSGSRCAQRLPDRPLVRRVQEPEQQAHRDRVDLRRGDRVDGRRQTLGIQGSDDPARAHPFPDHESQVARHQRRRPVPGEVVERGAVLPADLDEVAETFGGDQRGAAAPSFQQRVRGHRRTVREHLNPLGRLGQCHATRR